ncbi:MAG TPA: flagellar basal-body rod protein FlgG [Pirellulales bacterium]|jgi:flagellar basal-body rod protein FlgG|nr:flagellar basal-body rod protein FlgG [Pirellulales bacterium]
MSIQTLWTGATGMEAMQTKMDVIADNLANVNTTAFKRSRANFEDLYYQQIKLPGAQDAFNNYAPTGIAVGLGSRVQSTQKIFEQGAFNITNNQLDVAIEGDGFFQVIDPSTNNFMYTRAGNFSINSNGLLVVGSSNTGRLVQPQISIPIDTTGIVISAEGNVSIQQFGQQQFSQVGQLQLAKFMNPQGLLALGENLYQETLSSGAAIFGQPGLNGLGTLRQNSLEQSNVEPVNELIDLIQTQRAFELNSQTVQAGDQMLQLIANLRRF